MNKTFPILVIILIFAVIVGAYAFTQTNPQIMLNSSANMSNMNTTSYNNGLNTTIIIIISKRSRRSGTLNYQIISIATV